MSHAAPLIGVVLAGGESRRMGRDKGLLEYHGIAQRDWLRALLAPVCERVFLSLRADQLPEGEGCEDCIADEPAFAGNGPIGAVLTLQPRFPGSALLLLSCDLPHFDADALTALLAGRDPNQWATAFINPETDRPEPLVTVYEPAFLAVLPVAFAGGARSLQRIMAQRPINRLVPAHLRWIESVDDPEAYIRARRALGGPLAP